MLHILVHSLEKAVPPVRNEGGRGPAQSCTGLGDFRHNKGAGRVCVGADQVSLLQHLILHLVVV